MDLFDVLNLIGGLCLFLFGMNLMGEGLERRAGDGLKTILGRLTTGKIAGFLTGLGVTAIIQSSSATTVMVVGFVNSGLMTLGQAINVIMGANVGTTVTAWLLSLTSIESASFVLQLFKPSSFTPVLALIGIVLLMGFKDSKKKDTATILLGFATLMVGMDTMSAAVAGLKEVPEFRNLLLLFSNPILGVLAGTVLTAIIQSSSASVGILQALSSTGQVTFGAAVPIIMGQSIGTCVTAMLSSIGTNRNARRASLVHLMFNVIGTVVWLSVFCIAQLIFDLSGFVGSAANALGIAIAHTTFKLLCTAMMLPAAELLEKLSFKILPEPAQQEEEQTTELDERLMATPAIALEQCRLLAVTMARESALAMQEGISLLGKYDADLADNVKKREKAIDHYEDILGSYLVKLSTHPLSDADSHESAKLLHVIGDFERISDHAVNLQEAAAELTAKGINFTGAAQKELAALTSAVNECLGLALKAFTDGDLNLAAHVEPLEQVVDALKEQLRANHIRRLQKGECSIEAGFVWSDLLNDMERVSDHCSNIAGCVMEMAAHESLELHSYLHNMRHGGEGYNKTYASYAEKYLPIIG